MRLCSLGSMRKQLIRLPHGLQGALVRAFEPFLGWAARRYQAAVADHLIKYGLRYEDLLDPINDLVRQRAAVAMAGLSTALTHPAHSPLRCHGSGWRVLSQRFSCSRTSTRR